MQKVSKIILLICCFIQTPKFLFSQTNKINSHGSSLQKSSPGAHKVPSEVSYTTLGTQKWMTENLDVTHFRNGDSIPQALNKEEWIRLLIERKPAWCYFNFLDNQYGKIYNFHALLDKRGLTPNGWRIPIQGDINMLINFLGDYAGSPKSVDFESLVAQNVIIDNIHASLVVKGTNKLGFNLNKSAFVVYNKETLKDVVFVPEITFWSFLEPFTDEEINMVKRNLPNERLIQKAKITRFRNSGTGVQVGSSLVDWSINGSAVRCIKTEGLYGLQLDDGRVMSNGKWGRVNINGEKC